ncbi:amino acid adenylation domain-containing protein [Aquibacillus halophilus]|uniref:Amino acid adenylation domain-containing protein n=1 Tax=Aquibacillus halophilus TaxID=930132 RepID=A0A6A8DBN3_9BACI|nr:non-ribosomal peptide synthetase [Aquibacillus halophilus]MRH42710.1 amino acid adenylation domain-containing protein [Aquibacillus halophilus]
MGNSMLEKDMKTNLAYWKRKIGDGPTELSLPFDHPRTTNSDALIESYNFIISNNIKEKIDSLFYLEKVTSNILIMTVFNILLYRYSNEEDIYIGTEIFGVNKNDLRSSLDNTFLMITRLDSDMGFRDALEEVRKVYQEAKEHQLPFGELVAEMGDQKNSNTNRFFQVMLKIQDLKLTYEEAVDSQIERTDIGKSTELVDLTLKITQVKNELHCSFLYNENLFDNETMIRMEGHFNNLLDGVLDNTDILISSVPMLNAQERHQLIVEWNKPTSDYPRDSSINQLFEEQVELNPNNVAIIFENNKITYQELDNRANKIASYLKRANIKDEQLVAICLNRSPDMIASFLGVLKAGGAYLPIDLAYPNERIEYMLENSGISFLITTVLIGKDLPSLDTTLIYLDKEDETFDSRPETITNTSGPDSLAYVMYTSGSTGKPKGVANNHQGIVRLVKNITYANLGSDETILNRAPIAFDVSVFEIYGPLLNGGKLVIINSHKPTFKEIANLIYNYKVTTLRVGPDMLNILLEDYSHELKSLKQVFSGGEVLPVWLARKFKLKLDECQLINAYGPTENAVNTTCYHVNELPEGVASIPIGKPISNDCVYILDKFLQPVPIGVAGEIYITGEGIARGYLNKPELTNEKFPPDPFILAKGRKLYKSGDMGRYRSDGNIEFIGRIDDQVKIRGNRIELGEVETILGEFPGVRHLVAGVTKGKSGTNELVAYVVMNNLTKFDQQDLRSYSRRKLPESMIPTFFVEMSEIPVTPVGKIDRKRLPTPVVLTSKEQFVSPRNEVEEKLVHLWETMLDFKPIGVRDHYFDLGGNSLVAMRMFADIETLFHKKLPVSIIFQEDTIEKLANYLRSNDQLHDWSSSLVPIQPLGSKQPIFCVHGGGGEVLGYREMAFKFGKEQPIYGLRFTNDESSSISVETLAEKYVKEIKEIQPNGPYFLFGYCFGGAIAYEMAQKLIKETEKVSLLTILNFANPKRQPEENHYQINYKKIIINNLKVLFTMPLKQRFTFFIQKIKNVMRLIEVTSDIEQPVSEITQTNKGLTKAINAYKPKPYSSEILLIRANNYKDFEKKLGWETTKEGCIREETIHAEHDGLLKEPNVDLVVKHLKGKLQEITSLVN